MPKRPYQTYEPGDDPRMYEWPDPDYRWYTHEPAFHWLVAIAIAAALGCGLAWGL